MARIRRFEQVTSHSSVHPTESDAEWSIVETTLGRLLQVSTFGSDARASDPKVSQTVQFDLHSAALLRKAIDETYPELATAHSAAPLDVPSIAEMPAASTPQSDKQAGRARTRPAAPQTSLDSDRDEWASRGRADERVTTDLKLLVSAVAVLAEEGEPRDAAEVRLKVIQRLDVSVDELRVIRYAHTVEPEFDYRFRWAMTWAVRTGFVLRVARGLYRISEEGRALPTEDESLTPIVLERHKQMENDRRRAAAVARAAGAQP